MRSEIEPRNLVAGSNDFDTPAEAGRPSRRQQAANLRTQLIVMLVLDLVLPIGGYYVLRGVGLNQWWALVGSGLLVLPSLAYSLIRHRKVDLMMLFALSMLVVGTLMSLVSGDPRVLLIRDGWITSVLGIWVLATLPTQRPFLLTAVRTMVVARVGEEAFEKWRARWHHEPRFQHHIRFATAVWGLGLFLDAGVRVIVAYTMPIDAIPTVGLVQWLVVLAGLWTFHVTYAKRHDLFA